jgi:hypothetical protein
MNTLVRFPRDPKKRVAERGADSNRAAKEKERDDKLVIDSTLEDMGIKPFEQEYRKLRKLSSGEDFSASKASYALLRAQLAMVIQAMPVLERNLHKFKNEHAAYALVSLSSHARELSHDMRAFGDQTEIAERIREVVTQSSIRGLAAGIVQDLIRARQDLHSGMPSAVARRIDERLRLLQDGLAVHFTKAEQETSEQISRILNIK